MENKKYTISKDELNGLLFIYYGVLQGLEKNHGLAYKSAFQFKRHLNKVIFEFKDENINDYIYIEENIKNEF